VRNVLNVVQENVGGVSESDIETVNRKHQNKTSRVEIYMCVWIIRLRETERESDEFAPVELSATAFEMIVNY